MKTYYETLEIPKTAEAQDIKRAYFRLVKRFPPERFPEEFKSLREAYDALSDAGKRLAYDKAQEMPEEITEALKKAGEFNRVGKYAEAAAFLREISGKHPGRGEIQAALARSLEEDGKAGLAAKAWEEARRLEPDNAEYAKALAMAYSARGWANKADAQFREAVRLNGGDPGVWEEYINFCYGNDRMERGAEVCAEAAEALESCGRESAAVYADCVYFLVNSPDDAPKAEKYLAAMKRVLQSRPWEPGDGIAIDTALEGIMTSGNASLFPYIRDMAAGLPKKSEYLENQLETAGMVYEAHNLAEKGFPPQFTEMLAVLALGLKDTEYELDVSVMECYILRELGANRPLIARLRKEHPKLYALNAAFFDEAMRTKEPDRLISNRVKILSKSGRLNYSSGSGSNSGETVRRETPKVGRNDPCPCGSGKKYKRCCGMGA